MNDILGRKGFDVGDMYLGPGGEPEDLMTKSLYLHSFNRQHFPDHFLCRSVDRLESQGWGQAAVCSIGVYVLTVCV